ncbi:MAG: nuclease [Holophagales bacterium]|nr:nuclease [Holophagales bacterium]MYG30892.1 nuclease [Holophagales bacterium]MYI80369.1 nuclease [Holophagales bacterium]
MPLLKTYDIFLSHAWAYHSDYYSVQRFLNDAPSFRWRNYSVPEHDPLQPHSPFALREQLKRQIRPVNVVLILSGMYVAHSSWIQFEIDFANALSKPMIGVRPWGQQRVPLAVKHSVKEMVGWQTESIVSAVRRWAI